MQFLFLNNFAYEIFFFFFLLFLNTLNFEALPAGGAMKRGYRLVRFSRLREKDILSASIVTVVDN